MILEMEWHSQLAAGLPTIVGCGATDAQLRLVQEEISTSLILRSRLVVQVHRLAQHQVQPQLLLQVTTHSEMPALASGLMNATDHATADGAGLQTIQPSGILRTQSADVSDLPCGLNLC